MNMQRQIQKLVFGFFTLIGNLCVCRDAARRADASVAGIWINEMCYWAKCDDENKIKENKTRWEKKEKRKLKWI